MADLGGFNAGQIEPNEAFDVIPNGTYEVAIVGSRVKETRDGKGKYLELELQVLNGQYQNRKIWDRLNMWNQNAKAVEIAKGTLSAICRAVGILTPSDSSELHNHPMLAKVVVRRSEEYGDSNDVKGYRPRHTVATQPTQPTATDVGGEPSPW